MNIGALNYIRSIAGTHFTTAIASGAAEFEDIDFLDEGLKAGRRCRSVLRNLLVMSTENLDWEVWLFDKVTAALTGDPDTETVRGFWSFAAADARRIAGAGLYFYYVDGLYVPYEDKALLGQLHCALVNRSAVAKTANAPGALVVRFGLENSYGV